MDELDLPAEAEFTLLRKHLTRFKRRGKRRYRGRIAMTARVSVLATGEEHFAAVLDLSEGGAGLQLAQYVEVGRQVIVRLRGDAGAVFQVPASVAHTSQAGKNWRIGCEFSESLSADALDALL